MNGATREELVKLLELYVDLLTDRKFQPPDLRTVEQSLGRFNEALTELQPGERDGESEEEWRRAIGMCPDDNGHWYGTQCGPYECPTWREQEAEEHFAEVGAWR